MHPCLLYSYAPPKRYGAYSSSGSSFSSSEVVFAEVQVVSETQSGYSIVGDCSTGLYSGLVGLYGGEHRGASGRQLSIWFKTCCFFSSETFVISSRARF